MHNPNQYPPGFPGYPAPGGMSQQPAQPQYPGMPPGAPQWPGAPQQPAQPGQPPAMPGFPPGMQPATPGQQPGHWHAGAPYPQQGPGGWAAQVGNATVFGRGQYFLPGRYTADVHDAKIQRSGRSGALQLIVEFIVAESDNPEIKVGDKRSWICNLDNPSGQGDAKAFFALAIEAKIGQPQDSRQPIEDRVLEYLVGPDQPMRGLRFALHAWEKPQRSNPNKMFTVHDWRILQPGETQGLSPAAGAPPSAPTQAPALPGFPPPSAPAPAQAPALPGFPPPSPSVPQGGPPQGWPSSVPWGGGQ